jgi:hypothetical protein
VGAVDVLHEGDDGHQLGVVVERLPRENLRRRVPRNEPLARGGGGNIAVAGRGKKVR